MEAKKKIEFGQQIPSKGSKWMLFKYALYLAIAIGSIFLIWYLSQNKKVSPPVKDGKNIQEIKGVKIEE